MRKEEKEFFIKDGGFLQSSEWISFQKKAGKKVFILEEVEKFSANIIKHTLPFVGSYFFIPRGPVFFEIGFVEKCASKLLKLAQKNKVAWIRIEPQTKTELKEIKRFFNGLGFSIVKSKKDHQPVQTLMLSLEKPKEEILMEMKAKTRYNIRLAKKRGVVVQKIHSKDAINAFIRLLKETARRDGIAIHPENYYKTMLEVIPEKILSLYVAKFKGKIVAVASVSFFGSVATYLHGASSNENRNGMAPHLLQWVAISDAQREGFKKYDFGGTKIQRGENGQLLENNWSGITNFKLGFCPKNKPIAFPGCWDVVIDKRKYYTYRALQYAKNIASRLKLKIRKNA